MKPAIIRKQGVLCDVSADGRMPLDQAAYAPLVRAMTVRLVRQLFGRDVIRTVDERGNPVITRTLVENRRLYAYDDMGRLVCGSGYIDRIWGTLTDAGFTVGYKDLTPERDGAYAASWARVAKRGLWTPTEADKVDLAAAVAAGAVPHADLARRVKQDEILRAMARRVDRRLGGVVKVPPGVGKSFLMAAVCLLYPKAKFAVLVPDQDNFHKTYRHLTRFIAGVGARGCGERRLGPGINVFTFGSAHWVDDRYDILLVDEAHKAMAPAIAAELLRAAPHALRFAFTATPKGRLDKADARMEGMFGPIVYEMGWPEATTLGLVVPIEVRWIACDFSTNPTVAANGTPYEDTQRKRHGIWGHDARNARIAAAARRHVDDQVLIMVTTIEHALELSKMLPGFTLVYGQKDADEFDRFRRRGLVADGFVPVSREDRERYRLAFEAGTLRHVIATDVWSTGVSFDALQVLIRADARSSEIMDEQIPGRVSRAHAATAKTTGIL